MELLWVGMQNGLGQPLDFDFLAAGKTIPCVQSYKMIGWTLVVFAKRIGTAANFELSEAVQCISKLN